MPFTDAALAAFESVINGYIALDPEGTARLTPLTGRIIAFEFKGFGNRLYFIPGDSAVQVFAAYDTQPDCLIRGSPLGLASLGLGQHKQDTLFSGQVEIEGDTALAQGFGDFMSGLAIDWEEQVARLTGDPIAHGLGLRWRAARHWSQRSLTVLGQDLQEYLQEEVRLLPSPYQIEHFLDEVDLLRDDAERLAARVARLRHHLSRDDETP